jgi:hypothetical protein
MANRYTLAIVEPSVLPELLAKGNCGSVVWFDDKRQAIAELMRCRAFLAAKGATHCVKCYLLTFDGRQVMAETTED